MELALQMTGKFPADLMEQGIANIEIDKEFKGEEMPEDEDAKVDPWGQRFEEEESEEETVEGRDYHAAGNKRARVARAPGAAASSASSASSVSQKAQEAVAAAAAKANKTKDIANKSPDGWEWLKILNPVCDAQFASSIVILWRSGEEAKAKDNTPSLSEPLG
jgi:hypothetical protein